MKVKAVKYDDLTVGAVFFTEGNKDKKHLYRIKPKSHEDYADYVCGIRGVPGGHFIGKTVYILDEENLDKKWPEKMILVCRNMEEILKAKKHFNIQIADQCLNIMPDGTRALNIRDGSYRGKDCRDYYATDCDYKDYTFVEASDYFNLNPENIAIVSEGIEKSIQKGNNMFNTIAVTLESVTIGQVTKPETILMEPTNITAKSKDAAIFLAGIKFGEAKKSIPAEDLERIQVQHVFPFKG